jgi:hypothetical protein
VEYLGYQISSEGILMSPSKVKTITEWVAPQKVKDVQSFIGFANFYRRFMNGFSKIVAPLTELTKKGVAFEWSSKCQQAFEELKKKFIEAPILVHFHPESVTRLCLPECRGIELVTLGKSKAKS